MKIYTVYLKPDGEKTLQSAVLVPEGFSWVALIFPLNIISSIVNRNWALLMLLIIYFFTAMAQFHKPQVDNIITAIKMGLFPFMGVWAYDLLRVSLKHRGYDIAGVVSGNSEAEAQLRFFEQVTKTTPVNFHA